MYQLKKIANKSALTLTVLISLLSIISQSKAETVDYIKTKTLVLPETDDSMRQINNVFQLRDIAPVDWAYEALKNLVERYGCIQGYSDQTFKGSKSLTRWEFAAGLNACMTQIEHLIKENGSVLPEDLQTLKRLTQEFSAELQALGVQVNKIESRTAFLENHQFSTTTKLFGNVTVQTDFYASGTGASGRAQSDVQYNSFLALVTSFTGKDRLLTGIASTNTVFPDLAPNNNGITGIPTREGTTNAASAGDLNNQVRIITLDYQFPVNDNLMIELIPVNRYNFSSTFLTHFVPDYSFYNGPVSAFASAPPLYLIGGGGGAAVSYKLSPSTVLTFNYMTPSSFSPDTLAGPGGGLFGGDYVAAGQINFNPSPNFFLQGVYQKGYFGPGNFGFNNGQNFQTNGFVGTGLANRFDAAGVLFDQASAVSTNAYLLGGYYVISPKVAVGGWANLIAARLLGKGDATIWTYSVQLALPDLFKEGNLGGLVIGMEPSLTGLTTSLPHSAFKNDTSLHIETYYRHQINNNLSITPYFIWITAPNQDASNQSIIFGGFRTIFQF